MKRGGGPADIDSSALIRLLRPVPGLVWFFFLAASVLSPLWSATPLCAQEAISPLPPPVTRGLYRSRWFEFLSAHLEDDAKGAAVALADMKKAARAVGIHRLSDFSRTAVYEARKAEGLNRSDRARRAYAAAIDLDEASLDAQLSRIGFLLRQRAYGQAMRLVPEAGVALLETQEARLALFSSLALWAAAGFVGTVIAFILVLIVHHVPRMAHNLREAGDHYLGSRAGLPLALVLLALPFGLGLGPLWAGLFWGILVFPYGSKAERWLLGTSLLLLGFVPMALGAIARENIIERSPLYVAALDMEEQREDASAEDGLRQASTVFSEDPDVWFLLGMFAERSGDSERAVASYERAIAADRRDYRPFLNRGNVRFQEGDLAQAIRDYDAAAERAPRIPEIYYNLSIARGEAYDFDGQAAAMARAREISESRVRGWTERPTLARVVSAPYTLARARRKVEQWNAQAKSRRLPGHVPPFRISEALFSPFTIGPWVILGVALLLTRMLDSRGALALECSRCGKPFCALCKRLGEPVLFCSDCVRLYLRKEPAGIEVHVAQTREVQRRMRRRDWACRVVSLVLPGAHQDVADRPVTAFLTLFAFLFFLSIAAINERFYALRPLPLPHSWRAMAFSSLAVAGLLWLWSQRAAWRESHGP